MAAIAEIEMGAHDRNDIEQEDSLMGYIYCITSPSGKQYIGQTKYSMEKRFAQHLKQDTAIKGCPALGSAGIKYGWKNMIITEIERCSVEKLDEREIFWISHYDTFRNGYNLTTGGRNGSRRIFRPFKEARQFARNLKLNGLNYWKRWCNTGVRPIDIPSNPHTAYKDRGWLGYVDWLGTTNKPYGALDWLPFHEARTYARSLKLNGLRHWREWCKSEKRCSNIPTEPHEIYKEKGWGGYGDWLGTGNIRGGDQKWLSFEEARAYVKSLKLKGLREWNEWCKSEIRPKNIPSHPRMVYKGNGWIDLGDWLGTGNIRCGTQKWMPFEEARTYARSLGIKKWKSMAKKILENA